MPLPKPGENEEQKKFIQRCIPLVIGTEKLDADNEDDRKQAVAICFSQWRRHRESQDESVVSKGEEEVITETEKVTPTLTLSLPAAQRIASGDLTRIVHMGYLEEMTLDPVLVTNEGKVYAKVVLSRPELIGADIYSYAVKVLEVYDPPMDVYNSDNESSVRDCTDLAETQHRHSRTRCMKCNKPPVVVVYWADGRGRAWFCLGHFRDWIAEGDKQIGSAWHVTMGEVPKKIGDGDDRGRVEKLQDGLKQDEILKVIEKLERGQVEESLLDERVSWRLPPFSSEGGNYFLAPIIRDILPPHGTFVETHAGASNVLFSKYPVQIEVLNDTDTELIHAYESIRALTLDQLIELRGKNWFPWERRFDSLRESEPEDSVNLLYRFLYLSWYSFDSNRESYRGRPKNWSLEARLGRVENARVRLREVKLTSEDGLSCIARWDSPTTAFFLDPPFSESEESIGTLQEVLREVEGKFVLRISDTPGNRDLLSEYNVMSTTAVKRAGRVSSWEDGEVVRERSELLVTNCPTPSEEGVT